MRQYELTYLISDAVPETDLNKVTGKVCGYATNLGGKVIKEEIWGRRKLAYPIKKQDFATYVTLNFNLPAENAAEFEKNLFLTSKVVRHLMIVTDYGQEELKLTKEDLVETEAIEEVVGGERSFEAIEGETEESKDLMAKRETEEEEAPVEVEKTEVEAKPAKKTAKKAEAEVTEEPVAEVTEETPAEKKAEVAEEKVEKKKPRAKKAEPKAEEAAPEAKTEEKIESDRLSKLDKELDDILGDDL